MDYKQNQHKKVALGLSGGVDSAVCAYLLKQQGYDVTAVYLECWNTPGCRAEQDRKDALQVALQLEIPFKVLDFKTEYKERVMSYFLEEYRSGKTPNPDVLCNQVIKFGMFYDWAMSHGFDAIATGHYAQIGLDQDNKLALLTSKDLHKDQTYFLHQLKQEQLEHILFPVGQLLKDEVRQIAHQIKLPVALKKDSVGICFVGDIDVAKFLKENLGENPGEVITPNNQVIGTHSGLWFYTIGQRKSFDINKKAVQKHTAWLDDNGDLPPLFVINKDQKSNQLIVGPETQTLQKSWLVHSPHWINKHSNWQELPLQVRIRHTGEIVECKIIQKNEDSWQVSVETPLKGIASGQFAVFYVESNTDKHNNKQYVCLGGGVII